MLLLRAELLDDELLRCEELPTLLLRCDVVLPLGLLVIELGLLDALPLLLRCVELPTLPLRWLGMLPPRCGIALPLLLRTLLSGLSEGFPVGLLCMPVWALPSSPRLRMGVPDFMAVRRFSSELIITLRLLASREGTLT